MRMVTRLLRPLAILTAEVGAVVLLHRLGALPWLQVPFDDLSRWLEIAPPVEVFAAVARLVALASAWWLLASTVLYSIAAATRIPGAVRLTGWATLPVVRRIVDRAVALAFVSSSVLSTASPALAVGPRDPVVSVEDWSPDGTVGTSPRPAYRPVPAGGVTPPVRQRTPSVTVHHVPPPPPAYEIAPDLRDDTAPTRAPETGEHVERETHEDVTYEVRPGETLWSIAADQVAAAQGRDPAELEQAQIVPYWRELTATNAERVRSGDVDLIFPGETVLLPAPPQVQP